MADSPRWCDICEDYGNHHTDRHPGPEYVRLDDLNYRGGGLMGKRVATRESQADADR